MIETRRDPILDELRMEVTCDDCGDKLEIIGEEFRACVEDVKTNGWRIFKEEGEWVHLCPDCC